MNSLRTATLPDGELLAALAAAEQAADGDPQPLIDAVRARLECVGLDRIMSMLADAITHAEILADWGYSLCLAELLKRPTLETVTACAAWTKDKDARRRAAAGDVLAGIAELGPTDDKGLAEAMRPIVEVLLVDGDADVQVAAIRAFGLLCHSPRTDDENSRLLGFATAENEEVRWGILGAILHAREPTDIALLIRLSSDQSTRIRDWATCSLGTLCGMDSPQIRDALVARLSDEDADTRAEAMRGLALREDRRAVEAIAREIAAGDVSSLTIEAAGLMPDKSFLPGLEAMRAAMPDDEDVLAALEACQTGTRSPRWSAVD